MLASSLVIMAGMALNDVADREVDAAERPERPIPSGKIRAKTAARVAYILMGLALGIIGSINLTAILPAILLCYNIHLYNFVLKKLDQERKPFFYLINTTTTHDIVLPDGESYQFGEDNNRQKRESGTLGLENNALNPKFII